MAYREITRLFRGPSSPAVVCPPDGHNVAPARVPPMPAWTCYAPEEA